MIEKNKDYIVVKDADVLDNSEQPVIYTQENLGEDLLGHMGQISKKLGELGLKAKARW